MWLLQSSGFVELFSNLGLARLSQKGTMAALLAQRRRNLLGAWWLRVNTVSLIVDDNTASPSSSFLVFTPQDPCSQPRSFFETDSCALGFHEKARYCQAPWCLVDSLMDIETGSPGFHSHSK
jgi:hypothetical protein